MATDDAEPPFRDGSHRATAATRPGKTVTLSDHLRDGIERAGRIEYVCIVCLLVSAAGTTAGLVHQFSSSVLIAVGTGSVFAFFVVCTVSILTVDTSTEGDDNESVGSTGYDWSTADRPRVRRRP